MNTCCFCHAPTTNGSACSRACWNQFQKANHAQLGIPVMERLWSRVDKRGPDECWPWTGGVADTGYPLILIGSRADGTRKWVYVHRLIWESVHGPIPVDRELCHSCDVRRCCNLAHYFVGTHQQNMSDCIQKGRHCHGQRHHGAKLTPEKVLILRANKDKRGMLTKLAREFGVNIATAHAAMHGTGWRHI